MQTRSRSLFTMLMAASLSAAVGSIVYAQCPMLSNGAQASGGTEEPAKKATSADGVSHTSELNFKKDVLEAKQPVLVDFYATWCGPCRMLGPIVESTSKLYSGKMTFFKVDIDKSPGLAARFGVVSIPTIKIFKNGRLVESSAGFLSESELKELIQKQL